jgi:uncharacterized protein YsxB (DUF464 family)
MDEHGRICGFTYSGHAGFAKHGSDIVCAGVSVLAQTTAMALEQLLQLPMKVNSDPERAILECDWENEPLFTDKIELLTNTMVLGLREIEKQYPKYVQVLEVRCNENDPF